MTNTLQNRTHLTPEEVLEFINLGFYFSETADIWVRIGKRWERRSREFQSELDDMRRDLEDGLGIELQNALIMPAPNLQEVLNAIQNSKLSLYMKCRFHSLTLKDEHNYWEMEFTSPDNGVGFSECDVSLLEATVYCLQDIFNYNPKILT